MKTQPILSHLQLELLKLYANPLSERQLLDIKLLLSNYFAQQASAAMDEVWETQGLTAQTLNLFRVPADVEELLQVLIGILTLTG